ncbi:MarR family transcriptional regulator [Lacticaseibacillus pantheris]|uniref:MarR family transcriptional regulator n=1 Tax=Lacticaseibacillus pantheris TaxID=171523 RepID=UPI001CDABBE6|nr:helix-turn-helix domain-containing protein [Lacticaseibacillus pantheris]
MDNYAKQFGLTGTQMSILDFIGTRTDVLQRDIETEFNIQRSTATVTLQRMEKQDLVERHPSPNDSRQKNRHRNQRGQTATRACVQLHYATTKRNQR